MVNLYRKLTYKVILKLIQTTVRNNWLGVVNDISIKYY